MYQVLRQFLIACIFFNIIILLSGWHTCAAQSLYLGNQGEFFLGNELAFTTNSQVVLTEPGSVFTLQSGSTWGSEQEYVQGKVYVQGTGQTLVPIGDDGVYAPVDFDHSGEASAAYFNSSPQTGDLGNNVDAIADVEYWELTGNAVVTLPYNESSKIADLIGNNGNVLNSLSIVGLNSGVWNLISEPQTSTVIGDLNSGKVSSDPFNKVDLNGFGQFTFGIDHQIVLGLNDIQFISGIKILSNPIKTHEIGIQFKANPDWNELKASIYDINGKLVRNYLRVKMEYGEGLIPATGLNNGLYIIRFEHDGRSGTKKILIQ